MAPLRTSSPEMVAVDIDLNELSESRRPVLDLGWRMSSYELRCGVRVVEQPFDTLPGELQEELLDVQSRKRRSWIDDEEVNPFTGRR